MYTYKNAGKEESFIWSQEKGTKW